ncbi:hypothetical protein P4639_14500 [Priestia megaterium]|uniref:hypothetical protein n=1 Tax=Priestia megaterium TaxID=1404 RepID=UPI002E229214|nr:hypothetical protein [Priestia megaterium]
MINWKEWTKQTIASMHGDIYLYRDIYKGKHAKHFERARQLIESGEVIDHTSDKVLGPGVPTNIRTPYIVMNISKLIVDTPAILISRSIGKISSSIPSNEEQNDAATAEAKEIVDGTGEFDDLQNETIRQIEKNSKLTLKHKRNIVQHQLDGGLVGVPVDDDKGLRIEFKARDVYYPHEDGMGADLAYYKKVGEKEYLHVYRERTDGVNLNTENMLYELVGGQLTRTDDVTAREILQMNQLKKDYPKRSQLFIQYLPNDETFMDELGVSALEGQLAHQDEINWRLTRNGLVFERNSTPRLAVTSDIFAALQDQAEERFGEAGRNFIDHQMLEIVTMDENGKSMEVIQVDVKNIGGVEWADTLIREMLVATNTSQKAIDYFSGDATNNAVSGVAKFYDLFVSIVKAEHIQSKYVYFLKQLFEGCMWLANQSSKGSVQIEEPEIALNEMVPVTRTDLIAENLPAFEAGAMSIETFVRRTNPYASEEWIQTEIENIEMQRVSVDSTGTSTIDEVNDNRDAAGNPITSVDEE